MRASSGGGASVQGTDPTRNWAANLANRDHTIGFAHVTRFNYWYERLRSSDWAFDNATPTSSNNVILTGHQSSHYDNHVFGVSLVYTNW